MERKTVVIALGGNALGKDADEQKEAVAKTAKVIVDLAEQGLDIVVTHGNGPQVGMIQKAMDSLVNSQEGYKSVPLPMSVAMSQGYIGIDLQNAIKYELYERNFDKKVSTILSQVEVDKEDPAFENPTTLLNTSFLKSLPIPAPVFAAIKVTITVAIILIKAIVTILIPAKTI